MDLLRELLTPDGRGAANGLLLFLPPLLVLACPRARWWSRGLWALATQLCWAFVALYAWVRVLRYGHGPELPPLSEAIGWWSFTFPWLIYLVFRATHLPPPRSPPGR